jgi:hypothetical protein
MSLAIIGEAYLDSSHIGILSGVLVLIQSILGELSFPEVDAKFNEEEHHRLERCNRAVARSLGTDMFVEERQRGLRLTNADKFLGSLWRIPS